MNRKFGGNKGIHLWTESCAREKSAQHKSLPRTKTKRGEHRCVDDFAESFFSRINDNTVQVVHCQSVSFLRLGCEESEILGRVKFCHGLVCAKPG
jgi:hypothetical protein